MFFVNADTLIFALRVGRPLCLARVAGLPEDNRNSDAFTDTLKLLLFDEEVREYEEYYLPTFREAFEKRGSMSEEEYRAEVKRVFILNEVCRSLSHSCTSVADCQCQYHQLVAL